MQEIKIISKCLIVHSNDMNRYQKAGEGVLPWFAFALMRVSPGGRVPLRSFREDAPQRRQSSICLDSRVLQHQHLTSAPVRASSCPRNAMIPSMFSPTTRKPCRVLCAFLVMLQSHVPPRYSDSAAACGSRNNLHSISTPRLASACFQR